MNPYLKFVLALALTVLILVFIRQENDKTRDTLTEALDIEIESIVDSGVDNVSESATTVIDRVKDSSIDVIKELKGIFVSHGAPSDKSGPINSAPDDQPREREDSQDADGSSLFNGLVNLAVENTQAITEVLDEEIQEGLKLSIQEEQDIGKQLHNQLIEDGLEIIPNPAIEKLFSTLAAPIFEQIASPRHQYRFYVVNNLDVNAFALVGGHIYIHRGLVEFVDNDAQLQFVLAHEIGHVELGHCSKKVTYLVRGNELAGELGGTLANLAYQAVALGYSEKQELASDRFGYTKMTLDKEQPIPFFSRLHELQKSSQTTVDDEDRNVVFKAIEGHFASHPTAEQRIKNISNLKN